MKTVLVNRPIHPDAIEILKQEVIVLEPYTASDAELMDMLPEVNGILLAMGLNMTPDVFQRCTKLEVVDRHGAGVDIVNLEAAAQHGVIVTHTPYASTESAAELAFLLMQATARHLSLVDRALRKGDFQIRERVVGIELQGKEAGIVGFGRIGTRFGELCRAAFDMPVYVYDPYLEALEIESWGGDFCA